MLAACLPLVFLLAAAAAAGSLIDSALRARNAYRTLRANSKETTFVL